jgi:hypothetical protein
MISQRSSSKSIITLFTRRRRPLFFSSIFLEGDSLDSRSRICSLSLQSEATLHYQGRQPHSAHLPVSQAFPVTICLRLPLGLLIYMIHSIVSRLEAKRKITVPQTSSWKMFFQNAAPLMAPSNLPDRYSKTSTVSLRAPERFYAESFIPLSLLPSPSFQMYYTIASYFSSTWHCNSPSHPMWTTYHRLISGATV